MSDDTVDLGALAAGEKEAAAWRSAIHPELQALLDQGLELLARREALQALAETEQKKRKRAKSDAHWVNLMAVAAEDLGEALAEHVDWRTPAPDTPLSLGGELLWSEHMKWWALEIRIYQCAPIWAAFSFTKDGRWQRSLWGSGQFDRGDVRWRVGIYQTLGSLGDDCHMVDDLPEALALARREYLRRQDLPVKASSIREIPQAKPTIPTIEERVIEVLREFTKYVISRGDGHE